MTVGCYFTLDGEIYIANAKDQHFIQNSSENVLLHDTFVIIHVTLN
jgi:hypothetical protein